MTAQPTVELDGDVIVTHFPGWEYQTCLAWMAEHWVDGVARVMHGHPPNRYFRLGIGHPDQQPGGVAEQLADFIKAMWQRAGARVVEGKWVLP